MKFEGSPTELNPTVTESFDYTSLDLSTSLPETNTWLISYLDIFILTAALFASMLFFDTQEDIPTVITHEKAPIVTTPIPETTVPVFPAKNSFIPSLKTSWQNSTVITLQRYVFNENIQVDFQQGYAELSVGSAVLFDVSDASLLEEGELVLMDLIPFLKEAEGTIVVQGHTDSKPIKSPYYQSNWELASARANNVLHFLVEEGLERSRLSAVSYADTKPLVPNNSKENRRRNRRVNIVLLSPNSVDVPYHESK